MAILLTDTARDRIRGYLDADPAALGLRFGVSRSGWHDIRVRLTNRPGKVDARRGYHVAEVD